MKVTRKMVDSANAKMANGFMFDIERAVVWSEKQARRVDNLSDGRRITSVIYLQDRTAYNWRTQEKSGGYVPTLEITVWTPTGSGCYSSGGHAMEKSVGEMIARRNFSAIQKLTHSENIASIIKNFVAEMEEK